MEFRMEESGLKQFEATLLTIQRLDAELAEATERFRVLGVNSLSIATPFSRPILTPFGGDEFGLIQRSA
jgi:hypothetical protein